MTDIPFIDRFINSYNYNYISSPLNILLVIFTGNNQITYQEKHLNINVNYIFIIPSNIDISFKGDGEVFICEIPKLQFNNIFKKKLTTKIEHYISTNNPTIFEIKSSYSKFKNILITIQNEIKTRFTNYKDIAWLHTLEIFFLIERESPLLQTQIDQLISETFVWSIKDVITFIKNNFDSQFTLNELAQKCALNPSYFSRTFKLEAGIPLFEYINRLRVEKSCHLLKTSRCSVIEIAFSVGYNNVTFYNRYFKKIMNISPGEYRSRVKR